MIYSNRVCLKLFSYQLASTGVLWTCTTFQIHMGLLFISHLGSGTINNVISRKSSRSNICDSTEYALPPSRSQIRRGIEDKDIIQSHELATSNTARRKESNTIRTPKHDAISDSRTVRSKHRLGNKHSTRHLETAILSKFCRNRTTRATY